MLPLFLLNWQTTLAGAIPIVLAGVQAAGIVVPGVPHIDLATALSTLLLGFLAKDANK
jgi:hypothetical protein